MTLDSLLSLDRIIPDLKETEHWPAIQEMVDGCFACHVSYKDRVAGVLRGSN